MESLPGMVGELSSGDGDLIQICFTYGPMRGISSK